MIKDLISVVVPVYNVEKYLNKCVDSILNQTYSKFELILIDDGSKDNSGRICDTFSSEKNVKVIHKKNGGLSDARNVGILASSGEYITFIDSDDYVSKNYLESLYTTLINYEADLCMCNKINVYENKSDIIISNNKFTKIYNSEQAIEAMLLQKNLETSAWGKLYKTEMMKKNLFTVGKLFEDFDIMYKIFDKCNKIAYTSEVGYYYLQRNNSIIYSDMSEKKLYLIEIAQRILDFVSQKYPRITYAAIRRYVYSNFHLIGRCLNDDNYFENSYIMKNNILKYKSDILLKSCYSLKEKVATILLLINIKLYRVFWNMLKNRK